MENILKENIMTKKNYEFETRVVKSGYKADNGEPHVPPIVQSTTFDYDSADHVSKLFALEESGYFYSRLANPTVGYVEEKIADLEGGSAAIGTSSGSAAISLLVLTLCKSGDNIVAASNLYGGTVNLFNETIKRLGIEVRYVNPFDSNEDIQSKIDDKTRFLYGETIGNPGVDVLDIERFASIANENKIPLAVDSTFATPALCRPIEYGANIVIHSATKYLDGQATSLGGFLIDGGNFDWASGKFDDFTTPDPSYNGVVFADQFENVAFAIRARVAFLRDYGMTMAPFNAWLTYLGINTLALRMEKHSSNALEIAKYLESNDKVKSVNYPGLKSSTSFDLASKYLKDGQSGVLSFELESREKAAEFIDNLRTIQLAVHVSDVHTLVLHPASMTHSQLSDEDLKLAGVSPAQVRLSVGIESARDLIDDLDQAIRSL